MNLGESFVFSFRAFRIPLIFEMYQLKISAICKLFRLIRLYTFNILMIKSVTEFEDEFEFEDNLPAVRT